MRGVVFVYFVLAANGTYFDFHCFTLFAKYKANRISVLAGVNKMAFSSFRGTLKTKNQRSVHNRSLIFRAVYET